MRNIILIPIILLLAGCAAQNPTPVVYAHPQIQLPPDPIPATNKITEDSSSAEIMKAWVSTAVDFRGWNIAVRKLVENSR